jgi:hypothetical protein
MLRKRPCPRDDCQNRRHCQNWKLKTNSPLIHTDDTDLKSVFSIVTLAVLAILAISHLPPPPVLTQFDPRAPKATQESAEGRKITRFPVKHAVDDAA